ncbi:hypothetical protein AB0O39_38505 [Streptomyces anulatus]
MCGPDPNVITLQHPKDTVQQGVLHSREHKQHQEQREVVVGC